MEKIDDDIKNEVRAHINSIPRIESHYLRAQTCKEFIEGGKTIAELHRDDKLQCEADGKPFANYHLYSDIFNTKFNISFFIPKKDQCNLCYLYNNAIGDEKEELQSEYYEHQEEKNCLELKRTTTK
ncbi:hypothetical protein NQ314_002663 [Rhamnusium bicolor]|uniref:Uncharacterized protein n=1 Tax=Rhamnusium bicolor TaxID=1586634 RepID=A0AAV8ZRM5_9CUCU|nr:hypothetical protein NQ314_002663 [Rhamnusium bicolor]